MVSALEPGAAQGFERHMLVWLAEPGWRAALDAAPPEHRPALKIWQGQNWPAVVRRYDPGSPPDDICLGLPLPPDDDTGQKMRVALRAHVGYINKAAPAVELRAALRAAGEWRAPLAALERECSNGGLDFRLYGSLAMQALTGLLYLTPESDVDILFHPATRGQLAEGLAVLSRHVKYLPLDGEIVFPGGQAVSWKEWQMATANPANPAKVMVKQICSVRLADTASLLATLKEA
jgi:phosphoribosyl-dephospho-CoA transferase